MTSPKNALSCFGIVAVLLANTDAIAQDAESNDNSCLYSGSEFSIDDKEKTTCFKDTDLLGGLDLVVPENTLFNLIGSSPESVIRPKIGDKFSLSYLPQAVDLFGNEQYAIGFEVNPGLLMMPRSFTIDEFVNSSKNPDDSKESRLRKKKLRSAKKWSKFTLTGAATKSTDGQDITRFGAGVNYVLDTGGLASAQVEYGDCIKEQTTSINSDLEALIDAEDFSKAKLTDAIETNRSAAISFCKAKAASWNRTIHGLGGAVYHSEIGEPEEMSEMPETLEDAGNQTGFGIWASTAGPIGGKAQYNFSVSFTDDLVRERKVDEDMITETVDALKLGGRLVYQFAGAEGGGNPGRAVRGFVEAAYAEEDFGMINDSFTQAGVGVEVQLQDNLFFQATIGDTFGSEIDRSTYLSGQFKWAFSKAAAK